MTQPQIHELGVAELADAYAEGRLDPATVCEHLLRRIDDDRLNCNAFAFVDRAGALVAAAAAAGRWRTGRPLSPLDGVPVAIKDVLDVAGMPTHFGSAACAGLPPVTEDSLLAQRLRAAGAVLLGKTRTWEFAWRSNPRRDPAEVVCNPVDQARSPGGSSSGSAAAVAAGLCPLAFGTDSGGSVRGPAAFCGIVGFKPSHAMIPVFPPSPMGELEHIGIFARAVGDVRIALDRVGGRHPDDPSSWPFRVPVEAGFGELSALRFGSSADLNYGEPSTAIRAHFAGVIAALCQSGLRIEALDIPFSADFECCYDLFVPDAALTVQLAPVERRDLVDAEIVALADRAERMNVREYAEIELLRDETRRIFARLFEDIDCLLTLSHHGVAHRLDEEPGIMKQTRCFNVTGQPAISVPCGVSAEGLPIGLQLVCGNGNDGLLLALAEDVARRLASP